MGDTEPDMKRSRALSVESSPLSYSFTSFKKNPDLQDTLLRYLGVRSIEEIFEVVDGFKLSEGHTPVIDGDDFELLITRLKSVLKHVSLEYEAGVRIFVNDILLCVAEKCNLAIFPEKQVSRDLSTVPPVKLKGPVDYFISPLVDTIWLSKKSDGFFIIETKRAGLALDAIPTEGIQLVAQCSATNTPGFISNGQYWCLMDVTEGLRSVAQFGPLYKKRKEGLLLQEDALRTVLEVMVALATGKKISEIITMS